MKTQKLSILNDQSEVQVDKCVVAEQSMQSLSKPLPQRACPPVQCSVKADEMRSFERRTFRPLLNE